MPPSAFAGLPQGRVRGLSRASSGRCPRRSSNTPVPPANAAPTPGNGCSRPRSRSSPRTAGAASPTRRIAARAGVRQSLVHYHFGSVSALARRAAVDVVAKAFEPAIAQMLDAPDLVDGLVGGVRATAAFGADQVETRVMLEAMVQAPRDPALAAGLRQLPRPSATDWPSGSPRHRPRGPSARDLIPTGPPRSSPPCSTASGCTTCSTLHRRGRREHRARSDAAGAPMTAAITAWASQAGAGRSSRPGPAGGPGLPRGRGGRERRRTRTPPRILAGDLAPDAGRVATSGRLGYCPQQPVVNPSLTVEQHIDYFAAAYGLNSTRRAEALSSRATGPIGTPRPRHCPAGRARSST